METKGKEYIRGQGTIKEVPISVLAEDLEKVLNSTVFC